MELYLDNYHLSCKQILFAALTTTGGTLAKRHWQAAGKKTSSSKWGHRILSVVEAVPLLGGVITLIEIVVVRSLGKVPANPGGNNPPTTPPSQPKQKVSKVNDSENTLQTTKPPPHLKVNVPTHLTESQTLALEILFDGHESDLPEYEGSIFEIIRKINGDFVITRREKGKIPTSTRLSALPEKTLGPKEPSSEGNLNSEGLKVRTFCLDLLSNIEDAQIAKRDPITYKPLPGSSDEELVKLEEMKNVVRYFFEQEAFQKKAGYSDFLNLLNVLEKGGASELLPNFKRYADLVALQEKLPKKMKNKEKSGWDKIRTMVHSGLFVGNLAETAEHAKKIGLHPIPAVPQKQSIVNLYPTIDAMNIVDGAHREAARWIMIHVRIITFQELCRSIKASCKQMRPTILKWDNYSLLTVKEKSQEWMADIAYRYLPTDKMPQELLSMQHYSFGKDLLNHLTQSTSKNFILFDDGAYSCKQLKQYLDYLRCELWGKPPLPTRKNIYFVYGHFPKDMPLDFDGTFKEILQYNVKIEIISNLLTENIDTLMKNEKLSDSLKENIKDLIGTTRPQLATEWKKPDAWSTSMFITKGYLRLHSKVANGQLDIPAESVEDLDGVGPITKVIPPYTKP